MIYVIGLLLAFFSLSCGKDEKKEASPIEASISQETLDDEEEQAELDIDLQRRGHDDDDDDDDDECDDDDDEDFARRGRGGRCD